MFKGLLSIFILLFAFGALGQGGAQNEIPDKKAIIRQINFTVEESQVSGFLRKCVLQIDKGKPDGKPLDRLDYFSFKNKIKEWVDYRWFIADTGLSRKWLKSIYELIAYITKTKNYINASEASGNTIKNKKYDQAVKYYDVAYQRFVKLLEKPVKVSSKVRRKAKLDKVLWQKAMRKKYKIKEKPNMADF